MKDPEIIELKNRLLLGILISLMIITPFFFFFYNHLITKDSKVIDRINSKDSFLILVTENDCKKCKTYMNQLNSKKVDFLIVNKDKEQAYPKILMKLNMEENDIIIPTLIYIEDGELISSLADIKSEEELGIFLINYNLINEE